jgi:hypothetical protein
MRDPLRRDIPGHRFVNEAKDGDDEHVQVHRKPPWSRDNYGQEEQAPWTRCVRFSVNVHIG